VTPKLLPTTTLLAGPRFAADVRSLGCRRRDMLAVSLSVLTFSDIAVNRRSWPIFNFVAFYYNNRDWSKA
jgi:hypothetical protein